MLAAVLKDLWWLIALAVALLAVVVAVSRPSASPITAPDGLPALLVTCSSPGDCMRESAHVCPRGYQVLSQNEKRGTAYVYTGDKSGVAVPVDTYNGALMVRCSP